MARGRVAWVLGAALGLLLAACGAPTQVQAWSAQLSWQRQVPLGRQPDGSAVGPLALAAGDTRLLVANSFGADLFSWRREGGVWHGPSTVPLAGAGVITAVAVAPAVDASVSAAAVDAGGTLWAVPASGPARRWAQLPPAEGGVRRVLALALTADGTAVVDAVDISAQESVRALYTVSPAGAVRALGRAVIAHGALFPPGKLLSAPGVRQGMAPCGRSAVWLAVRADQGAGGALACVGVDGAWGQRRSLPPLRAPADFLGVDRHGNLFALQSAGLAGAAVVAFGRSGRPRWALALPLGSGPLLPHPAALAPDGALWLAVGRAAGLRLIWLPPRWRGRALPGTQAGA